MIERSMVQFTKSRKLATRIDGALIVQVGVLKSSGDPVVVIIDRRITKDDVPKLELLHLGSVLNHTHPDALEWA